MGGWPRNVRLNLAIGDVVDIDKQWVAVLAFDDCGTATLMTHKGDKERILSEGIETEITPAVWVTRATATTKSKTTLTLQFQAQKAISIRRRREPTLVTLEEATRFMRAARAIKN